jgi:hypothetical protein
LTLVYVWLCVSIRGLKSEHDEDVIYMYDYQKLISNLVVKNDSLIGVLAKNKLASDSVILSNRERIKKIEKND